MTKIFILTISVIAGLFDSCGQTTSSSSNAISASAEIIKIKVGNAPGSCEIADLNNDKLPDLVVTSETDSSVTVLLGKEKMKFEQAKGSPFPAGYSVNDFVIGDFNNDHNADLAIANHDRKYLTLLAGNGQGSFSAYPKSPFPVEVIPHTHGIAAGDFNKDGRLDLVTDSWGNDQVEVLFGDSINGFTIPGRFFKVGKHPYQRVRVSDVSGDGSPDIITTNLEGDNVTILLSDGKGDFKEAAGSPFASGDSPFNLAIGDINADGKPDLAIINSPASTADRTGRNGLTVLVGDGKGGFTTMKGSPYEAGKIPNRVAIGDVNGDGVNDIVTSDSDSDKIYLFLMKKNGSIVSGTSIIVGNHPKGIAIADLNGDGKGDIVVCDNLDNDISIIKGR